MPHPPPYHPFSAFASRPSLSHLLQTCPRAQTPNSQLLPMVRFCTVCIACLVVDHVVHRCGMAWHARNTVNLTLYSQLRSTYPLHHSAAEKQSDRCFLVFHSSTLTRTPPHPPQSPTLACGPTVLAGCRLCFDPGFLCVQACAALERAIGALDAGLLPQPTQATARTSAHLQKAMQDLEVRQNLRSDPASEVVSV